MARSSSASSVKGEGLRWAFLLGPDEWVRNCQRCLRYVQRFMGWLLSLEVGRNENDRVFPPQGEESFSPRPDWGPLVQDHQSLGQELTLLVALQDNVDLNADNTVHPFALPGGSCGSKGKRNPKKSWNPLASECSMG